MGKIYIDKLIKSNRKTVSLRITKEGKLIVRIPKKLSLKELDKILIKKKNWILKAKEKVKNRMKEIPKKQYIDGEQFFYFGEKYPLKIVENTDFILSFDDSSFVLNIDYQKQGKEAFIALYKKLSKVHLIPQALSYAEKFSIELNKIKISNASKRWGSCNTNRNINLSWRLIMLPQFAIDYVIVHELVHLYEMNHSSAFWNKMSEVHPEFEKGHKFLKDNGHLYNL